MSQTAVEPIKVLADILQSELELDEGRVMCTNQRWPIPGGAGQYGAGGFGEGGFGGGAFIALSYINSRPIGTRSELVDNAAGGTDELQSVSMQHMIQIDVMSFDNAARIMKELVLLALSSIRSNQMQETHQLQIGRIPSDFLNVSEPLEGTAMLERYTATVPVKAVFWRLKSGAEVYTQFPNTEVTVNE